MTRWQLFHTVHFHSFLAEFSGEQLFLRLYKTHHIEVVWTKENAGNSEFTLFAAWLIPLYKVLQCQNTVKICKNEGAKTVFPPRARSYRMGKDVSFLAFTWSSLHDHQLTNHFYYNIKFHIFFFFMTKRNLHLAALSPGE